MNKRKPTNNPREKLEVSKNLRNLRCSIYAIPDSIFMRPAGYCEEWGLFTLLTPDNADLQLLLTREKIAFLYQNNSQTQQFLLQSKTRELIIQASMNPYRVTAVFTGYCPILLEDPNTLLLAVRLPSSNAREANDIR